MTAAALRDLPPAKLAKHPLVARLTRKREEKEPVRVAAFNSYI